MELEHDSGDMDGKVLKGEYSDSLLSSLSLEQLLRLHSECVVDNDSRQVLEAYIERQHADWREHAEHANPHSGDSLTVDESTMNRSLAMEILGLVDLTSKEEVTKAHRQLMQKLHPDRGGSDYLAKKINAAKDYLLDELQ
jgi:hypothetical protein